MNHNFFRLWNLTGILWFNLTHDTTTPMWKASRFSCDMTMISYFNISINISIITNPTFPKVLKIYKIFCSHYKFLVKIFFHHITTAFAVSNNTINKIVKSTLTKVWLKLTKFIVNTYYLTTIPANNMFLIFVCIRPIWILLSTIFWY